VPLVEVLNKADLLDGEARAAVSERTGALLVSALTGEGIESLRAALGGTLQSRASLETIELHPGDGQRLAWLHANGEVVSQAERGGLIAVDVRLSERAMAQFRAL
jgi:GTP-binding protein HflX